MRDLQELERKQDYVALIRALRQRVAEDRRVLTDPYVKEWCGRRWRDLFIREAAGDRAALKAARRGVPLICRDGRPPRRKIAERFVRGSEGPPRGWELDLPEAQIDGVRNTTFIFCPGLLTGLLPVRAFESAFPAMQNKYGLRIVRADLHPMKGCDANAEILLKTIERGVGLDAEGTPIAPEDATPPGDVCLICYSKGLPDALTLLAKRPELQDRVRCVFGWAGAAGGSYVADDAYKIVEALAPATTANVVDGLPRGMLRGTTRKALTDLAESDIKGAFGDLTTARRAVFLEEHGKDLDALGVPFFSLSGATSVWKVPLFQISGFLRLRKHDPDNDMQLTQSQAKIPLPMATHLAMLNGHHWDLSYGAFPLAMRILSPNLSHPFPKEAAATAMFKFAAELGLVD